jgi:hypothetical protein
MTKIAKVTNDAEQPALAGSRCVVGNFGGLSIRVDSAIKQRLW